MPLASGDACYDLLQSQCLLVVRAYREEAVDVIARGVVAIALRGVKPLVDGIDRRAVNLLQH